MSPKFATGGWKLRQNFCVVVLRQQFHLLQESSIFVLKTFGGLGGADLD